MRLLKFEKRFFTSRVARRIFTLLLMCSILPLLIVSLSVYQTGRTQLINHSLLRLEQECRGKRIEIYGNLLALESIMQSQAVAYLQGSPGGTQNIRRTPAGFGPNLIESLVLIKNNGGETVNIKGNLKIVPKLSPGQQAHLRSGQSVISMVQNAGQSGRVKIYLLQLMDINPGERALLVAQVNAKVLCGIEDKGLIPHDIHMVVLEKKGGRIIYDTLGLENNCQILEAVKNQSPIERVNLQFQGNLYMGRFRILFLSSKYLCPDLIILMLKEESSMLSSISDFTRNLLLFMLATFLIALFLSMFLIRKSLIPLTKLKEGTAKIAGGHLGTQVEVLNDDEFGDLAQSFNEMSTNLEKGRKILIQSAKMSAMGEMALGIIHEISQPLTSIFGYLLLLNDQNLTPKQQKFISIIQQEHKRLEGILQKFKQFSRPADLKLESISLNHVLDETIKLLNHQIKGRGINFFFQKEVNLPDIHGDQNTLKQVFINLVINAMDALENNDENNREILVKTYRKMDKVKVDVQDNGPGIPPQAQERIFDPFYTTKSAEKGSGLGLSIVKNILDQHQAEMELESIVHSGTRFTLTFSAWEQPDNSLE